MLQRVFLHKINIAIWLFILSTTFTFSQDFSELHISEFMADNATSLADEDGDFSDWIELHNPNSESIDLEGWYLSDNSENLIKWILPGVTIEPNGFLVIFASGKDRRSQEIHTNFRLSSSGEELLLTKPDGSTVQFETHYGVQYTDVSYGYLNENLVFFNHPTPGSANVTGDFLSPPTFSVAHGFFENPFNLKINSVHNEASIIYTLDGSSPGLVNGIPYSESLVIDSTYIVRAVVTKNGNTSPITTSTFLFPEKVKNQPFLPDGYPATWGSFSKIYGNAPADYSMDSEICNSSEYKDKIVAALTAIPTLSLVTDKGNFFSLNPDPKTGGIYIYTAPTSGSLGKGWERPVSIEYIFPDGSHGFQVDCGVRIHGGASRLPEKNPKHSFRLVFKDEYGPKKLNYNIFGNSATESFNSLVLRGGFNQTWLYWDNTQRERAQYINDSWAKDIYRKMGHISANNKFVHLYINGLYWGLYNISERMDDDFMDYYLNGGKEDFDVIKDYAEVAEGNADAWNTMMAIAAGGLSDAKSYYGIQGKDEYGNDDPSQEAYLNVKNLIDYMILNFYAGNQDWDHHNWVAARNRVEPGNGFQFFPWDSERIFNRKPDNIVDENNENCPSFLYTKLQQNPIFRNKFKERANELLGPGGLLSPDSVIKVWDKRSKEIEHAIIAESARWGDYRRDLHTHKNDPYELYTKNDHWQKEQHRLIYEYFPERSEIVLNQLKNIGLAGNIVTHIEYDLDESIRNMHGIYPNPFYDKTRIFYKPKGFSHVSVKIYTKEGQFVKELFNGFYEGELLDISWKPKNIPSGVYLYRITTDQNFFTGKMIFLK